MLSFTSFLKENYKNLLKQMDKELAFTIKKRKKEDRISNLIYSIRKKRKKNGSGEN